MELADSGDLLQQINAQKRRGTLFAESQVWSMAVQTLRGLKVLHDLRILHRDIKCANVFMCRDGTVKLGDMNVAKVAKAGLVYTQTGTPYYASPEVWKDQPYDSKSDLWSVGCVIYEMVTLQPPFRGSDMSELYKKVTRGHYADLPTTYSQDLSSLVRTLLQVNPVLRPSCDRLLAMPVVARHMKQQSEESSEQSSLLSTIKVPRDLRALGDQLPAPHYLPSPREILSVFSNRHEHEKPPSHDTRSRNLLAPPTQQREGRSLSAARPDIAGHQRNLSSDSRQLPDVFRAKSKDPTRLPPSPHPPAGLVHTPNSQVLRGDQAVPKAPHPPRANIFASQR
jgi:serine/threonine protein kinase